jgi:hypothetical protein
MREVPFSGVNLEVGQLYFGTDARLPQLSCGIAV